ncbi:DUF5703 domain-containing protein [Chitinophaga horti]|uniref:DUF5703 domain-containing protein n=1 Tax=Chitinophaga horti TaxID=2920382 RepID=A0ABY6JBG7_9BACT|nr:DUF5703 domain-containing protein [Chitinophaga horti]UYQ95529.1 DUF5703 domain-containing protein [Chitinophaga horti]
MTKILFLLSMLFCGTAFAQADPSYNIVWHSPSDHAGASMPCGGGDIGMNVWVEKGELLIYAARSGSFDEHNGLMKAGRLRIRLTPNPFEGEDFRQELHLQEGYVSISGKHKGTQATVQIWADVHQPVAHISIKSNQQIKVDAGYESWRYRDRAVASRENFGNSWKWAAPKNNIIRKDSVTFEKGGVLFVHHNSDSTIFDATVAQQQLQPVKDSLYNPLKKLAFGGLFYGDAFIPSGTYEGVYANTDFKGWRLISKQAAKSHQLHLALHTAQTNDVSAWRQTLQKLTVTDKRSATLNRQWWQAFWQRSFIEIDPGKKDSTAWQVGRNYQLFRYMLACNAYGNWPTKFNGGLLTVDPVYTDTAMKLTPDYRNWGGGLHTMQNQRLVYFPMIRSGDWDMMQAHFEFYYRIQRTAELRSKVYWNHDGACFTEQMENFGLPNFAEYGQKRPAGYDPGMEFNAWLEYEWDTVLEFCLMMLERQRYTGKLDPRTIPFIESCLQFFDEHYQYLARKRGSKALDGNGKLVLYPGSAAETYKMAYNASSTIAALTTVTKGLVNVLANDTARLKWQQFLQRIPPIAYTQIDGHTTIAPAKSWERINNVESPQLYPVFPWGMYGVGKPGLDTALNTWHQDTSVIKFRSHVGWKQDNIWAARLGLREEAWRLTALKLQNSSRRFPAFWGPGFDWAPDHNWGGSGMIGLQEMLLQTDGDRILLFPGWPGDKDVHFKLHAPRQTTVEATLKDGKVVYLQVEPATEAHRVEVMLK